MVNILRKILIGFKNEHQYNKALSSVINTRRTANLAVIIHLFYTDNWPLFVDKLKNIESYDFDLYITIPGHNNYFVDNIRKDFPQATVVVVPNQGRDVLPFVKVAGILRDKGYDSVLKFHSKKSTHRDDGQQWLEGMLSKLLPNNQNVAKELKKIIEQPKTGIIGPSEVYYPLTVNFPANGKHMTRVVNDLYGKDVEYRYLQANRADYGFFGGTMFWARLDAIGKLLDFKCYQFEVEHGQIDGTFAHALERLFCIIPEIDGLNMYEVSPTGIVERAYASGNIPEWSQDHMK